MKIPNRHPELVSGAVLLTLALCTLLVGCGSLNQAIQLVHDIHQDSTYHQNIQYDSIYIYRDRYLDRGRDTIYLRETEIEYRYKLLRDTVRIVQRDSIPYEVLVTEIKEVRYIPWWSKALSALGALCLAFIIGRLALKR